MTASSPGWFGRHWKWFVPVGCVTVLLLAVAVGALLGYGAWRLYEGSGVAAPGHDALAAARAHPALVQALGEPVERGLMMSGNVRIDNDGGAANLRFRLQGPRGRGAVHVVGRRVHGRWHYDVLQATVDGQSAPIDLRNHVPPSSSD